MYRRYTVHRDGDLLVEDLDAAGKPLDPEPVPPEDRLPVEVVLLAPDSAEGQGQLLDLLELALEMETTPDPEKQSVKLDPRPAPDTWAGNAPAQRLPATWATTTIGPLPAATAVLQSLSRVSGSSPAAVSAWLPPGR
jgi:hypothetical protein